MSGRKRPAILLDMAVAEVNGRESEVPISQYARRVAAEAARHRK